MAVLYTAKDIDVALKKLRIQPVDGLVSTNEAARILTWRAKEEEGVEHRYDGSTVRRRVMNGDITAYPASSRFNRYKVEDVFALALVPRRGLAQLGTSLKKSNVA